MLLKSKVRMCQFFPRQIQWAVRSTVVRNCYAHQYQQGHGPVPENPVVFIHFILNCLFVGLNAKLWIKRL